MLTTTKPPTAYGFRPSSTQRPNAQSAFPLRQSHFSGKPAEATGQTDPTSTPEQNAAGLRASIGEMVQDVKNYLASLKRTVLQLGLWDGLKDSSSIVLGMMKWHSALSEAEPGSTFNQRMLGIFDLSYGAFRSRYVAEGLYASQGEARQKPEIKLVRNVYANVFHQFPLLLVQPQSPKSPVPTLIVQWIAASKHPETTLAKLSTLQDNYGLLKIAPDPDAPEKLDALKSKIRTTVTDAD